MESLSEEKILEDFGKRFKAVRNAHKLTQEAFDVDSSTIRRIESGKLNPSYLLLKKVSSAFKTSPSELLKEIEEVK
jgi:transcriptional regulator with XRE-family HTH domain